MSSSRRPAITVLLLGGSRRVSLAQLLKRSGQRLGYDVRIVAYELDLEVPIAVEGTVVKGLSFTDPGVIADLARVIAEYDVKIILPIVNGAMETASICKREFPDVFVPISDVETATIFSDKIEAAKAFREAGIPTPKTYTIIDNDMPLIAKPRKGGSSRGIKVFHNMDDFMRLENIESYLLQEFIEEFREYTVDCYVAQDGRILATVPRERLEVMGGEVTRTITSRIPELIDMSRQVIKHFGCIGPVSVQYLHDTARDRFLLNEVIPRLGGGVICSIYAGAPITDYILQEALGISVSPCTDWADRVLMARYQKEAIFFNNQLQ